jgi:SAM-dependent methyltransferase
MKIEENLKELIPGQYHKYLDPERYMNFIQVRLTSYYDKKRGLDFIEYGPEPVELGLNPELSSRYEPSDNITLHRVLKDLEITQEDNIIDVGCGKGSAMRTMLKYPFSRVDGIEISGLLSDIAEKNFRILKTKNVRIFNIDAAEFKNFDDYNYIYFYNSFPENVMRKVVENIAESLKRKERALTIIYANPICAHIIENSCFFRKDKKEYLSSYEYKVCHYSNF